MSKYRIAKTKLEDQALLIEALIACSYPYEEGQSLPLYGYHGDIRPERAQIVIRRMHIDRSANDIGFVVNDEGISVIISDYDSHSTGRKMLNNILTQYNIIDHTRKLEAHGFIVKQRTGKNGNIELVAVRRTTTNTSRRVARRI